MSEKRRTSCGKSLFKVSDDQVISLRVSEQGGIDILNGRLIFRLVTREIGEPWENLMLERRRLGGLLRT